MLALYLLAALALLVSTAAIYMALIRPFPVEWLYYHYFMRKPVVWGILAVSLLWTLYILATTGSFPSPALIPLMLMVLAVGLTYRMHQETALQDGNALGCSGKIRERADQVRPANARDFRRVLVFMEGLSPGERVDPSCVTFIPPNAERWRDAGMRPQREASN